MFLFFLSSRTVIKYAKTITKSFCPPVNDFTCGFMESTSLSIMKPSPWVPLVENLLNNARKVDSA